MGESLIAMLERNSRYKTGLRSRLIKSRNFCLATCKNPVYKIKELFASTISQNCCSFSLMKPVDFSRTIPVLGKF